MSLVANVECGERTGGFRTERGVKRQREEYSHMSIVQVNKCGAPMKSCSTQLPTARWDGVTCRVVYVHQLELETEGLMSF
jgi:hypothetical protein